MGHDIHDRLITYDLCVTGHLLCMNMYWSIVCVSNGLLLLSDSPHLGESVFGKRCLQSSGVYAAALLFVCWG